MADTGPPRARHPGDWSDALGALPMENAPADGWSRVAAALPSTGGGRGRRWRRMRPALAASMACVLPVAGWLVLTAGSGDAIDAPRVTDATGPAPRADSATRATPAGTPEVAAGAGRDERGAHAVATGLPAAVQRAAAAASPPTATPDTADHRRVAGGAPGQSTPRHAGPRRTAPARTPAAPTRPGGHAGTLPALAAADPTAQDELADLRDASARLETLVALARDERVSSAPAVVLAASLDDRIRAIDAALAGGGDSATLWRERVDTLQALAVLEGTQRWMAAHGASPDAIAQID